MQKYRIYKRLRIFTKNKYTLTLQRAIVRKNMLAMYNNNKI